MARFVSLMVLVIGLAASGCNRYSYPPSQTRTAGAVNQDLFPSQSAQLTRNVSNVTIEDMKCQGPDYAVTVSYSQSFEEVSHLTLQYEVSRASPHALPVFSQPTGTQRLDPQVASGETTLVIPADQVRAQSSDILVRLRLATPTVLEHTSGVAQVHLEGFCSESNH